MSHCAVKLISSFLTLKRDCKLYKDNDCTSALALVDRDRGSPVALLSSTVDSLQ